MARFLNSLYGNKRYIAAAGLAAAFIRVPVFFVRVSVILALPFVLFPRPLSLKREHVFAFCLTVFYFAFIFVDIPALAQDVAAKVILLTILGVSGAVWAYTSSSESNIDLKVEHLPAYLALFLGLFIVNFRPLMYSIAYRGDEDYHISTVMSSSSLINEYFSFFQSLMSSTAGVLLFAAAVCLFVIFFVSFRKKMSLLDKVTALYLIAVTFMFIRIMLTFGAGGSYHFGKAVPYDSLQYPYIQKWITKLIVLNGKYNESLYRSLPFISTVLLSWLVFYKTVKATGNRYMSFCFSFAIATMPTIYFYSSLFYPDMLAMLLIAVSLFDLDALLRMDFKDLAKRPSWICFIMLPFAKDTAVVFSCLIVLARIIVRLSEKKFSLSGELKFALSAVLPHAVFVSLKLFVMPEQGVQDLGFFGKAKEISSYFTVFKSIFAQTGLLLLFSCAGLALIYKKDRPKAFFLSSMVILYIIFYMGCKGPDYIGYARWYLTIVPVGIFLAAALIERMKSVLIRWTVISSLAASNLLLMPMYIDGTRISNWGSPLTDTSEHSYRFKEAFDWLSKRDDVIGVAKVGGYFHYSGNRFYVDKYRMKENGLLSARHQMFGQKPYDTKREWFYFKIFFRSLIKANYRGIADYVVYQSVNNIYLEEGAVVAGEYRVAKAFRNPEHTIYIFEKMVK